MHDVGEASSSVLGMVEFTSGISRFCSSGAAVRAELVQCDD